MGDVPGVPYEQQQEQQQEQQEQEQQMTAHKMVAGQQLNQMWNGVEDSNSRIKALYEQAEMFHLRAQEINETLREIKKEVDAKQAACTELKGKIEAARENWTEETKVKKARTEEMVSTREAAEEVEKEAKQDAKEQVAYKRTKAEAQIAVNDQMRACLHAAEAMTRLEPAERAKALADRIEAVNKTRALEAQIKETRDAIRAHEEARARAAARAEKRAGVDAVAKKCTRLQKAIAALEEEFAKNPPQKSAAATTTTATAPASSSSTSASARRPSSAGGRRPNSAGGGGGGRRPASAGRKKAAAAKAAAAGAATAAQQEQEQEQEQEAPPPKPAAVMEEDEATQEGQRNEQDEEAAAMRMVLQQPPGGEEDGGRASMGSDGEGEATGKGNPPVGGVEKGGQEGQREDEEEGETIETN